MYQYWKVVVDGRSLTMLSEAQTHEEALESARKRWPDDAVEHARGLLRNGMPDWVEDSQKPPRGTL